MQSLQTTFCLLFLFTAMAISADTFYLSLRPTLHPSSPCSAPWRQTDMHCLRGCPLMSYWIRAKIAPQEAVWWKESRVWVFLPQDSSLQDVRSVAMSSVKGGLSGSPVDTAVSSDNCALPGTYCFQVLRYHLGFPTPCFMSNTLIKLHSDHPVWMCPISCRHLIKYLSPMINFL